VTAVDASEHFPFFDEELATPNRTFESSIVAANSGERSTIAVASPGFSE
jgi:hypothetical protein